MCEKTEQICEKGRRGSLMLRQAGALHEFASLGLTAFDAAVLLDVSPSYVCKLRKRFDIKFQRPQRFHGAKYRAVLALRQMRLPNWAIAERIGSTSGSVASMAYQMRQVGVSA